MMMDESTDVASLEDSRYGFGPSWDQTADNGQMLPTASCHADECSNKGTNSDNMMWNMSPLLQAIVSKHGEITSACTTRSESYKKLCLEGIDRTVQMLRDTRLANLNTDDLKEFYLFIEDAEDADMDVKWLHHRLDEIAEAMASRDEFERFEEAVRENTLSKLVVEKAIERKRAEELALENEIQELEKEQAVAKLMIEDLKSQIEDIKSSSHRFHHLLDGLF